MSSEFNREDLQARITAPETFPQAYSDLKEHLKTCRTIKEFHFGYKLLKSFENDPERQPFRQKIRLALLASYTVDFLHPLLQTDLMLEDLGCEIYRPQYNQFRQEILNPASGLYAFRPEITVVAFGLEDVFQNQVAEFATYSKDQKTQFGREVLRLYESLASGYWRSMPTAGNSALLLEDLALPFQSYDPLVKNDETLGAFVEQVNGELASVCRKYPGTYVLEHSKVVARCGARGWTDPRLYYTARIPVAQQNWLNLSDAYVRYIKAVVNLDAKCVVLDLDNTLWGGILGEDGIEGLQLGDTYPGIAFRKFQEYLLSLYASGYILAVASKNNSEDVHEAFDRHKGMVLKEDHFAAIKANWREKAENIRDISKEINISIDHMLFVDDNPVEIHKVRSALPGISYLRLNSPPLDFLGQFDQLRCFGKLAMTQEDKQRGQWYFQDRKRRELQETAGSMDHFYRSLEQRLTIYTNHRPHLARIAQLSQRTNQFNMTTIRLTEREVEDLFCRPEYLLITAELADRFGDNGIIAYVQVRKLDRVWQIENFLMSCRVLGRMVEESVLNYVLATAREAGAEAVLASYRPSKKNAPFAEFYPKNGFVALEPERNGSGGERRYRRPLQDPIPACSALELVAHESGSLNQ